jgi:isoquinoline 1-oxidoreductase beta subunit
MINLDIVRAQVEGGAMFGLSAAMNEQAIFVDGKSSQHNFHDYRVLRMPDAPPIEVYLMTNAERHGGVGEVGVPAVAPAVCNAIFAAVGVRIRALPIAPALKTLLAAPRPAAPN